MIQKYGIEFPDDWNDFDIERFCFLRNLGPETGHPEALGSAGHAIAGISLLWPEDFIWTPWAEGMIEGFCRKRKLDDEERQQRGESIEAVESGEVTAEPIVASTWASYEAMQREEFIGLAGCASSGKTATMAVWGIWNYVCEPTHTKVFATSTSLKAAKNRIWGQILHFWSRMTVGKELGKPVKSYGVIEGVNRDGNFVSDRGLELIAGEQKREAESSDKLIGFKAPRVIFLADELSALSHGLVKTAKGNLNKNAMFQFIGSSNPDKYGDPFGLLCEPKDGWESISAEDEEWESKEGYVLHFDGTKNPNIQAGRDIYPMLMTNQDYKDAKESHGETSPSFWRMIRGFWSPTGKDDAIYSEPDLIHGGVLQIVTWRGRYTPLAFMDPDFSSDGDGCAFLHALLGEDKENKMVFNYEGVEYFRENREDDTPRSYQIVELARKRCADLKIEDNHFGFDGSAGSGQTFGDVMDMQWTSRAFKLSFGGSASTREVMYEGRKLQANDIYWNKVTELWYGLKEFLFSAQIAGLRTELQLWKELTTRLYEVKGKNMVKAEPKKEMRGRVGYSPNEADALVGAIELARTRMKFSPTGIKAQASRGARQRKNQWNDFVRNNDLKAPTLTPNLGGGLPWH